MSTPKRRKPNPSTACDACQRRKSRCEMVEVGGCLRCRTLDTACSLANGTRSPSQVASSDVLGTMARRLERVEGMLERIGARGHQPSGERESQTISENPLDETPGMLAFRAVDIPFVRFPAVTDEAYDAARASLRIPLLQLPIPPSRDPFLRLVVVSFHGKHPQPALYSPVAPTPDAVLGLLILSYVSTPIGSIDVYSAASRASLLVANMDLDLKCAVAHRKRWVTMLHSPSLSQGADLTPLTPLFHAERHLLDSLDRISHLQSRIRRDEQHDTTHVFDLEVAMLDLARSSPVHDPLTHHLFVMLFILKITSDAAHLLPSPLNYEDRFGIIKSLAPFIVRSASNAMDCFVDANIPAFHLALCCMAYRALRQTDDRAEIDQFRDKLLHAPVRQLIDLADNSHSPEGWKDAMHDWGWDQLFPDNLYTEWWPYD